METKVVKTAMCPTGRSAIYRLKRLFYRTMLAENALELSRPFWRQFVTKLVAKMNEQNLTEMPQRISIEYSTETTEGKNVLKLSKVKIEIFEKVKEVEFTLKDLKS